MPAGGGLLVAWVCSQNSWVKLFRLSVRLHDGSLLDFPAQYYGEEGLLDNTPLPLELEKDKDPRLAASPLRFPGRCRACPC
jgi:hypothetical protein